MCFVLQSSYPGRQGTLGRNVMRGFPLEPVQLHDPARLSVVSRKRKLQFRAEMFNALKPSELCRSDWVAAEPTVWAVRADVGARSGTGRCECWVESAVPDRRVEVDSVGSADGVLMKNGHGGAANPGCCRLLAGVFRVAKSRLERRLRAGLPAPRFRKVGLLVLVFGLRCVAGIPPYFEPNVGQLHPSVQFLSRGVYLGSDKAAIQVGDDGPVVMTLSGARAVRAEGLDLQPGITSYFLGNEPSKWRSGVPHYARVRYRNVYSGIDVVYHHNAEGRLEYDFGFVRARTLVRSSFPTIGRCGRIRTATC